MRTVISARRSDLDGAGLTVEMELVTDWRATWKRAAILPF